MISRFLNELKYAQWLNADRLRIYPYFFIFVYVFSGLFYLMSSHDRLDFQNTPMGTDFIVFYAAATQVLTGHANEVYDLTKALYYQHLVVEKMPSDFILPFYYPPTYLLMISWIALLPFAWAFFIFAIITLFIAVKVLQKLAPPRPESLNLILAFPGVFIVFLHGQNSFLITALIGGGLFALLHRPILAGFLFGLTSIKPQYTLIIPLALLFGRYWNALIFLCITIIVFGGLSYLAFGDATWDAFFNSLPSTQMDLKNGIFQWYRYQSVYGITRLLGGSYLIANVLQVIIAIIAISILLWLWADHSKRNMAYAALPLTALLITPHLIDYDLMLLSIPIALLSREALRTSFLPWEKTILMIAWLYPGVAINLQKLGLPLGPVVMLCLEGLIIRRCLRAELFATSHNETKK